MDEITRLARDAYRAYACCRNALIAERAHDLDEFIPTELEALAPADVESWRAAAQDVETELHNQAVLAWQGELAEWTLGAEQVRLNGVEDELNKEKSHGCP